MMRLMIVTIGLFLIALAPFAFAGSPSSDATMAGPVDDPPVDPVTLVAVDAAGSGFASVFDFGYEDSETGSPVTVIGAGSSVTWWWDQGIHSVTHGVGNGLDVVPPQFDSGIKRPSDDQPFFIASFPAPGVYEYYCTLHPSMRGTVVAL